MEGVRYSEGIPQENVVERVSVRWEFLRTPFLHLYPVHAFYDIVLHFARLVDGIWCCRSDRSVSASRHLIPECSAAHCQWHLELETELDWLGKHKSQESM